jgi:L-2-hydroxyglutarate oxidase LhgO
MIITRPMDYSFDVTIIGAGVVGLAVAARLARPGREVCVVERHDGFGRETSSRNSEVVHSGIYYPPDSLKTKLCLRGRLLTYELCERHGIRFARTGKLVVAARPDEVPDLEELLRNGRRCGVEDLVVLDKSELARLEPNVCGEAALWSPSSGIVDSHGLMRHYEGRARTNEAAFFYNAEAVGLEPAGADYRVSIRQAGETLDVRSRVVVNSAGLESDRVAALAGIDVDRAGYRIRPCKGEYFRLRRRAAATAVDRLVYPVPRLESGGLGVHVTIDFQGQLKLGPNAFYVSALDYEVDPGHRFQFYESARVLLPRVEPDDVEPDQAGIRPKLQGPGEGFRDFIVRREDDRGLVGLVDLVGIESPGLTAAPAIAERVESLIQDLL